MSVIRLHHTRCPRYRKRAIIAWDSHRSPMARGVHDALSLILFVSKVFGTFVMRAEGQTYVFSFALHVYFIVLMIGAAIEGVVEFLDARWNYSSSLLIIMDIFVFSICITTAIIVIYLHYSLRESLPDIISVLDYMDNVINNVSYNRHYNYGVIFLGVINTIPAIFALIQNPFHWNELLMWLSYYCLTITPVLISGQYATLLHILSRQLKAISERPNLFDYKQDVWKLVDIHHNLVVVADRINRAFDIFLFHMITFSFIINILRLYFVIVYIVKPVSYTDLEITILYVVDFLFTCGSLIIIVFSAMDATKKAEAFNAQLLKNLLNSKTLAKDEKIRTYLVMKHSIQQTACNFFTLDYNLLTSMAAGTTTYVILLVQFTLL